MARTVMGYSANQLREQLQAPAGAAGNAPRPRTPTAPAPLGEASSPAAASSNPSNSPSFATSATVMAGPPASVGPAAGAYGAAAASPSAGQAYQPPAYQPPPPAPAYQPPPAAYQPPPPSYQASAPSYQPPPAAPTYPSAGGYQQPPPAYQPPAAPAGYPALAPATSANAATMFVPSGGNAASAGPAAGGMAATMMAAPGMAASGAASSPMPYGQQAHPYQAGSYPATPAMSPSYQQPSYQQPFGGPQGYQPVPVSQPPPYLASQTADRAGRPVDPYRDGIRLVLFAFGILLLGAFCTPIDSSPTFHWNVVLHAPGQAKVASLLLAAIGALAIVIASIPMSSPARGVLALGIALLGIVTPLVLAKVTDWRALLGLVAPLLLVPGLLLRQEYREHLLPRVLVTLGVLGVLALLLVPIAGTLPLVGQVKMLVDAAGKAKVAPLLELIFVVVVVLTLLVWLPPPSSAGAKLFAWILIFWGAVMHFQRLILSENLGEQIKTAPFESAMAWAPTVAYLAIFGYGLAAMLGKRLESA
jgi:hypothetical protein